MPVHIVYALDKVYIFFQKIFSKIYVFIRIDRISLLFDRKFVKFVKVPGIFHVVPVLVEF